MAQLKVRIEGTPADVALFAAVLHGIVDVLDESRDYSNRGRSEFVRRYLRVQLDGIKAAVFLGSATPPTAQPEEPLEGVEGYLQAMVYLAEEYDWDTAADGSGDEPEELYDQTYIEAMKLKDSLD